MGKTCYTAWIGTNSARGSRGIYTVFLDGETLSGEITHTQPAYNAGALALDPLCGRLFAASEGMVFLGRASGGVTSYDIRGDGSLVRRGEALTKGQRPCSLAVRPDGGEVYAANFFGGSMAAVPVAADGSLSGARLILSDAKPAAGMHAMHCVGLLADGEQLGVLSVTRSSLVIYDRATGAELADYCFGKGAFPRSLAVRGDTVYVMLQDPGDIYVLHWDGEAIRLRQKVRIRPDPPDFYGTSVVRLTPDGTMLLAGVRRTDTIAVFALDETGLAEQTDAVALPGDTPRDLAVSPDGRIVVTALQASDEICVHEVDRQRRTLVLKSTGLHIPSPAAVVIRKEA